MERRINSGRRAGSVYPPSSKSLMHRLLICAALSSAECTVSGDISQDIIATADCLSALGAGIVREGDAFRITPISTVPGKTVSLRCGESGSTLRFLLPVVGALGADAIFRMQGRLSGRPTGPLISELTAHGMDAAAQGDTLHCSGRLLPGDYSIPGDVSSQFVSGLLMALPLLCGDSKLTLTGKTESASYISMTERMLENSGLRFKTDGGVYFIKGNQRYGASGAFRAERDWSGAAFFICMGAVSEKGITVLDMDTDSVQGDKKIIETVKRFGAKVSIYGRDITVSRGELRGIAVDASDIPDLVPAISAIAAGAEGVTEIYNAKRLRYKESDRLRSTANMLNAIGAEVIEKEDGLVIYGKKELDGGFADPCGDHRIAMAAATAACLCRDDVIIKDPGCTEKSYPAFWDDFDSLEVSG